MASDAQIPEKFVSGWIPAEIELDDLVSSHEKYSRLVESAERVVWRYLETESSVPLEVHDAITALGIELGIVQRVSGIVAVSME